MIKRFINMCTASLLLLVSVPVYADAKQAEEPGFTYTIIDNEAEITGFKGEPECLVIPDTIEFCAVTRIRDNAFYGCSSLKQVILPESIREIGHHSFYACSGLGSVVLPDSVTSLGMGCFCGCASLGSIELSEGLSTLPESCLRACPDLHSITLPDSVKSLGDFCFSGDTGLEFVSLGDELISIGDCAFYMCNGLKGLYIPPSVEKMGVCCAGYIPTQEGAVTDEEFVIIGAKKSPAHTYARENHLRFISAASTVQALAIQEISRGNSIKGIPFYLLAASLAILVGAAAVKTLRKFKL